MDDFDKDFKELLNHELDIDKIHMDEELIQKTLKRVNEIYVITNRPKKNVFRYINLRRMIMAVAVLLVVLLSYSLITSKTGSKKFDNGNESSAGYYQNKSLYENQSTADGGNFVNPEAAADDSTSIEADRESAGSIAGSDAVMLYENIASHKSAYDSIMEALDNYSVKAEGESVVLTGTPEGKVIPEDGKSDINKASSDIRSGMILYNICYSADAWSVNIYIYDSYTVHVYYSGSKDGYYIYEVEDIEGFKAAVEETGVIMFD